MPPRLFAVGITLFWGVMNFLLWRSATRGQGGAPVPWDTVARRVLEAAESSTLLIRCQGESLGQLRWTPTVLQENVSTSNQLADDGMVTDRTGYAIDFEINLVTGPASIRGHGNGRCEFDSDRSWRRVELHFFQRPLAYELSANAADGDVQFRVLEGTKTLFTQKIAGREPASLGASLDAALSSLVGFSGLSSWTPGFLTVLGGINTLGAAKSQTPSAAQRPHSDLFRWDSRTDELQVARQRVRTYHVTAHLLNQYRGDFWIGHGGELLRVTLPNEIELIDQSLPLIK